MINSAARQILSKKLFERTLKKSQTNKQKTLILVLERKRTKTVGKSKVEKGKLKFQDSRLIYQGSDHDYN